MEGEIDELHKGLMCYSGLMSAAFPAPQSWPEWLFDLDQISVS